MKSKLFLGLIVVIMVFTSACGGSKPTEQKLDELKITMKNNMSYGPILIAEAEGYFTEFGIQMEYVSFDQNTEALALLLSGSTDVYAGTLNVGFLNTISGEENFKAVADRGYIGQGECTYQAIVIGKDLFDSGVVNGPEDLAGQTFSVTTGGPSAFLLDKYLAQGGLSEKDIITTNIPTASEIEGYANKSISGSVAPEPNLTSILESGNAVILARAEDVLGIYQSGIIAFGKNLLVDDPGLGARFLAAYLKGVHQYNEGKTDRNMQIMIDATGETRELLQAACWPPVREDGMIDFNGVDPFQQWAISSGLLENPVISEQFFDPSILTAAQDLLNP